MSVFTELTAIANAIRAKTGKAEPLSLFQMAAEIAGIQTGGGGGIVPTASFLTKNEISQTIASYPFKPKYKNELIIWNTTGSNLPPSGSITPYAFITWIINGKTTGVSAWISGAAVTRPWETENYAIHARNATFSLDDSGNLTVQTGLWGFIGANNTCTIYEIALPIGSEVLS